MASDAVGLELLSRIVGYKLTKGDFSETTPNLPMRVAIIGEANAANQSTLDTDGQAITTAQQAGEAFGYGSPIYHIMRILRPISGTGIGGIPTIVYAQDEAAGATAKVVEVAATGVANANGTHTVVIGGRQGVDGEIYDININVGDDAAAIAQKIEDAVNNVLGSPVIAAANPYVCNLTTKWKGLTANELSVSVLTNGNSLGITYAVSVIAAGSGTPSIAPALAQFGNEWVTIVVNSYGTVNAVMDALEAFNGIADPNSPTGRYSGIIFKPFIAITGSIADDPSAITDARKAQMTIAIAPAPLSAGFSFEAAANMTALVARTAQDTPHLDVNARSYPDMPTPASIGSMAVYLNRDAIMKKGCSTVDKVNGVYQVQDFVTTYHPVGEIPPQFRYSRNLMLDWNVRFGYFLLEQSNVVDHVIANDADVVNATRVIKPKRWKGILFGYADGLALRGLVADPDFMKDSLVVNLSTVNPDRLETFFRYKRTGIARIASTTAEAGFNFGTNN